MNLQTFKNDFYCKLERYTDSLNVTIISKAFRKSDDSQVDAVKTVLNIQEKSEWIIDSQQPNSLTQWDWERLLDQTKRGHLDWFARRAPIDNFFPLNNEENPDIDIYYRS